MRTEIKIGVAAATFIAMVAVLYFFLLEGSGRREDQSQADAGQRVPGNGRPKPDQRARAPQDGVSRRQGSRSYEHLVPATELPSGGPERSAVQVASKTSSARALPPAGRSPLEAKARGAATAPPAALAAIGAPPGVGRPRAVSTSVRDTSARAPGISVRSTQRVYIVQEGDHGFQTIAEKVYGSIRHWELIRDANPETHSEGLRVGQKLKIPRLPPEPAAPPAVAAAAAAGEGKYVVQEDDTTGFWGIAKKVYGDASLYPALAKANPDVHPRRLRAGRVIVVPRKPAATAKAGPSGSAVSLGPGDRKYVVQEGDLGFWTVAVKMYGRGHYWPVIRRANPGADPRRLRAGQELVVPKLTEEVRKEHGGRSAPRSVAREPASVRETEAAGMPRPIFD